MGVIDDNCVRGSDTGADGVAAAVNAAAIASPLQSELHRLDAGCSRHGSILEHEDDENC